MNVEIVKHATYLLSSHNLGFSDIKEGTYVYLAAGKESLDKFHGSLPNDPQYILRVLRSMNKIMNENLLKL